MRPSDPTTAWLLGEGPEPSRDCGDSFIRAELPPGLAEATLAAVEAERATERSRRSGRPWWAAAVAASALAAAALLSLTPAARIGDIDRMTRKGMDIPAAPEVALKMAVRRGNGDIERLRRDTVYSPGDAFFFRYSVGGAGELHLLRAAHGRVTELHSRHVEGGEADLRADSKPLVWTAGPADGSAVFALVTTAEPEESLAESLALTLPEGADAEALCAAAEALGARCDARAVEVMP